MYYRPIAADNVKFKGNNGDVGDAYYSRPTGSGSFPGVVLIHHMPSWDEMTIETSYKLARNGFATIAPHLYFRQGIASPDDAAASARAAGGMDDKEVMGDVAGAMQFLRAQPESNGKVGIMGFCSGGRHSYIGACVLDGVDAAVDCWGGYVIVDDPSQITPQRPVAPIDLTETMHAPLLGIFGNDDKNPNRSQVDATEEVLKRYGKSYEFHRYDDAAHAFFSPERKSFRPIQAKDGWEKVFAFFHKHLA
jgi:carboxymethylenebutenolidase